MLVNFSERTETSLITGVAQSAWAAHSCNSWFPSVFKLRRAKRDN